MNTGVPKFALVPVAVAYAVVLISDVWLQVPTGLVTESVCISPLALLVLTFVPVDTLVSLVVRRLESGE